MTSFDVHQHLWPEQLIEALRKRSRPPRLDGDQLILGHDSARMAQQEAERIEGQGSQLDLRARAPQRAPQPVELEGIE